MKTLQTIALLTDFGNDDAYVASMKGMIRSLAPAAQIIDISHSVKPQNITQASYLLWSVYRYFPKRTIFVAVVDPGVGGKRKIICAEGDGYIFLTPDNGLLQYVANEVQWTTVVAVTNEYYFNTTVSRTFHGRDIFAPVAAHISNGVPVIKLGLNINKKLTSVKFIMVGTKSATYKGKILHIDHFGNIITDFLITKRQTFNLKLGNRTIDVYSPTYEAAPPETPFLIKGSSGLLEITVKNGNAAATFHATLDQSLELTVS
jgi:S-adenosyl-L-methionine hydrolase (adenosine-forming)